MTDSNSSFSPVPSAVPRRTFLRVAGASAATVGLVLAGCGKTDPTPVTTPTTLSFGTATSTAPDVPTLNYLFFIKQLEFGLYDKVVNAFPADVPTAEQAYFRDLRDHELVQAQTLANVLGPSAIGSLAFDFTSVTLTTRAGVLAAASKLEDTSSSAFLSILPLVRSSALFTLLSKMSSVEARHAALVRNLLTPGSFASDDVLDPNAQLAGQALARTPAQVVAVLQPFLPTLTIDITSLPTA